MNAPLVATPNNARARGTTYAMLMLARRESARFMNVWGQTIVPPVVSAALFFFVFGHALGDRINEFDGVPYLTFIVPGLVIQGAVTNAFANTGSSLFDARRAGYIDDILTSPLKDWQIVMAYMLSGMVRGVSIAVLTIAIAIPVATGWNVDWLMLPVVLLLSCGIFALLGILIGLVATRWDHVIVPQTFVMTPLIFMGGVFYPVELLSPGLEAASRFNPILYIVDLQRGALLGSYAFPVLTSLLGLVAAVGLLYAFVLWRFQASTKLRG